MGRLSGVGAEVGVRQTCWKAFLDGERCGVLDAGMAVGTRHAYAEGEGTKCKLHRGGAGPYALVSRTLVERVGFVGIEEGSHAVLLEREKRVCVSAAISTLSP